MSTTFATLFHKLGTLSNVQLDLSAERAVFAEQRCTIELICHIAEIGDRKLHIELGYSSLHTYCVERLGLSDGAVYLRTQVAGIARRFPQFLTTLAENRINLTVAGKLAPHVDAGNVERLLSECAGMTRRDVEVYVATLAPKPPAKSGVRARRGSWRQKNRRPIDASQPSSRSAPDHMTLLGSPEPTDAAGSAAHPISEAHFGAGPDLPDLPGSLEPATSALFNFKFSADRAFKQQLERLGEVLGLHAVRDMVAIVDRALDEALERLDPQRKRSRRLSRERTRLRKQSGQQSTNGDADGCDASAPRLDERVPPEETTLSASADQSATAPAKGSVSRHIPVATRENVLARAGYRCEYTGPAGHRCTARTGLEIEHTVPFAVSPSHDEAHLRAYCRNHNQFAAERFFGQAFIADRIKQRRMNQQPAE